MIVVLCDLIADLNMRLPASGGGVPGLGRLESLGLGPGGASNIAIMAARFGLPVACLGEVGEDRFGRIVAEGLAAESIDISGLLVSPESKTPVAAVLVDPNGQPDYFGYPGQLQQHSLAPAWAERITKAQILFAGGWAERDFVAEIVLAGFQAAHEAGVPVFFDPGPGNPELDNTWWQAAIRLTTVLLLNQAEAEQLSGQADPIEAGRALLQRGPELVVLKRGALGCLLLTPEEELAVAAFPVEARDTTGAGDSLTGAVMYSYLNDMPLAALGVLANATGAAKVRKFGTGHNLPTLAEIADILQTFDADTGLLPLGD